jgi:hypothetical protein
MADLQRCYGFRTRLAGAKPMSHLQGLLWSWATEQVRGPGRSPQAERPR